MASFTPPEPPFEPDEPTPPPTLTVPLAPPLVGEGSPWAPVDAENRDHILDWWRMWWRRVFFPWVTAWTAYWDAQWNRLAAYVNTWITAADTYITDHAVSGYSWRTTATPIAHTGTTNVTVVVSDPEHRPLIVGDLISDDTTEIAYGIVTAVIDPTHATVQYLGQLHGPQGILSIVPGDGITVNDEDDPAHPIVSFNGSEYLIAGANIGLDFDTNPGHVIIASTGGGGGGSIESVQQGTNVTINTADPANPVVSAGGGSVPFLIGAAGSLPIGSHQHSLMFASGQLFYWDDGNITRHVLSTDGLQAGAGISITYDGVGNPIVAASGGSGVAGISAGQSIVIDNTDPTHPIVKVDAYTGTAPDDSAGFKVALYDQHGHLTAHDPNFAQPDSTNQVVTLGFAQTSYLLAGSLVAGDGITIDYNSPTDITISAPAGSGIVQSIGAGSGISVDDSDPANPVISVDGVVVGVAGTGHIHVDNTDPANPIVGVPIIDSPAFGGFTWKNSSTIYGFSDSLDRGVEVAGGAGNVTTSLAGGDGSGGAGFAVAGDSISLGANDTTSGKTLQMFGNHIGFGFAAASTGQTGIFRLPTATTAQLSGFSPSDDSWIGSLICILDGTSDGGPCVAMLGPSNTWQILDFVLP